MAVVIALHLGVGYVLVSGLGHKAIEVVRRPLEAHIVLDIKPPPCGVSDGRSERRGRLLTRNVSSVRLVL